MSSYPAIEALEREGVLFRRPELRNLATPAGADQHPDAKLAAATRLRDGIRDAVKAGLSPAEISALIREFLKEAAWTPPSNLPIW